VNCLVFTGDSRDFFYGSGQDTKLKTKAGSHVQDRDIFYHEALLDQNVVILLSNVMSQTIFTRYVCNKIFVKILSVFFRDVNRARLWKNALSYN